MGDKTRIQQELPAEAEAELQQALKEALLEIEPGDPERDEYLFYVGVAMGRQIAAKQRVAELLTTHD
jgi:hypothetical protein